MWTYRDHEPDIAQLKPLSKKLLLPNRSMDV